MQRKRALVKEAEKHHILIPDELKYGVVRGVYEFYACKESGNKHCFYVGRAVDISRRIYDHITNPEGLVFQKIQQYQEEGSTIIIEIKKVDYELDNYYRDMQRLAYAEYERIETHQKNGECLYQLPEGNWISKDKWEKFKKKG